LAGGCTRHARNTANKCESLQIATTVLADTLSAVRFRDRHGNRAISNTNRQCAGDAIRRHWRTGRETQTFNRATIMLPSAVTATTFPQPRHALSFLRSSKSLAPSISRRLRCLRHRPSTCFVVRRTPRPTMRCLRQALHCPAQGPGCRLIGKEGVPGVGSLTNLGLP